MASTSGTRLSRRLLLLALLLSCFCSSRSALAQDKVRLDTLYIKVIEKGTERSLLAVTLSIPRGGSYDDVPLRDITLTTNTQGEASKKEVDFDFSGNRQHTLTVTAEGYKSPAPLLLNDLIRQSNSRSDKRLDVPTIELERQVEDRRSENLNTNTSNTGTNVNNAVTENVNRTSIDQDRNSSDWLGIPAFFSRVASGVNYVAFWLGWLTILFIIGRVAWYFVIRRRRTHVNHHSSHSPQVSLKTLDADMRDLKATVRNAATKKDIEALVLELQSIKQSISNIKLPGSPTGDGQSRSGSGGSQGDSSTTVPATVGERKPPMQPPFKERAHQSFLKLANRETPDEEPFFVEVPTKSTLFGKLADSTVYLAHASHRQSAFVLFTEDNKQGWVFPNPVRTYRKPSLKDVFPDLTEEVFDGAKERIEPVHVVRADESDWKVG